MASPAVLNRSRIVVVLCVIAAVLAAVPRLGGAEIAPYAEESWGVYSSVTAGTLTDRIDSEVMAIEQIGGRVFVGGKFTEVRNYPSAPSISRPFLAAFEVGTGNFIADFTPNLSGPVYALHASPDGSRLFVGGEFGDVDGVANTKALVALDPVTGAVDTGWRSHIQRNGRAVVYELDVDSTWLYVGGSFDGARGVPLSNATKLSLVDGAPDGAWRPAVQNGSVWGIAVSPDSSRVYLAGYFLSVNGQPGTAGFVPLTNSNAQVIPGAGLPHNNANRPYYLDVEAVNNLVFVAGMEHIVYALNASNFSIVTEHSTGGFGGDFGLGGDYQDLEVVGDRVYASCHCRGYHFADGDIFDLVRGLPGSYSRQDSIKFVAAYSATNGAYIPSFTLDVSGSSGSWAVHGATDGCLWIGGDLTRATRANGTNQGRGGFTRHCDPANAVDNERPSVPTGLAASQLDDDSGTLTWNPSTDNVGVTSYQLYRAATNGGPATLIGSSTTTSYQDDGLAPGTYWYYVRAVDGVGNLSWRSGYRSLTIVPGGGNGGDTERPSTPTGLVTNGVWTGGAILDWNGSTDNVGVVGYRIYDAGGTLAATTGGATDKFVGGLASQTTYSFYVKAIDAAGNESWRSNIVTFTTQ